jgi:glycosyltransferase involved in cell wall biosynthesis
MSARKGLELVVGLSHRLTDLADRVHINVVGGSTMWSDYSRHLESLNPDVATYRGSLPASRMPEVYAQTDILLVPSHFEPGSLVVGEGLAMGIPIVASENVGPVEVLPQTVCRIFPDGDLDALEREVRTLVEEIEEGRRNELARLAREEAIEQFAPPRLGEQLASILTEAAAAHRRA